MHILIEMAVNCCLGFYHTSFTQPKIVWIHVWPCVQLHRI